MWVGWSGPGPSDTEDSSTEVVDARRVRHFIYREAPRLCYIVMRRHVREKDDQLASIARLNDHAGPI